MRVMQAHKTYRQRGYCTAGGHRRLDGVLRECATLYNAALQERRDAHRMAGKSITYYDQCRSLTGVRSDLPEWEAMSLEVGRGALRRVDRAFQSFFRRVRAGEKPGFPRFKSRHRFNTIEIAEPTAGMVRRSGDGRGAYIRIKGLPTVTLRTKRPLPEGTPKNLQITRRPTGIVVSLTFEVETQPLQASDSVVGIDMGVARRMTLSDGGIVERRAVDSSREKRLRKKVSQSKRGSNTRRKRVRSLSRETYRNRVRNRNACHEVTSALIRRYGKIAMEDLSIDSMTRSARGTEEDPGRNVAAKSGLNRSILEQTWGMIRHQLTYKAEWAGREFAVVDPRHTSQTCSRCGLVEASNRQGRTYQCATCGLRMDADRNAAINILLRAQGRGYERPGLTARTAA